MPTSHYGKLLYTSSPGYDFQSLFRMSNGIVQSHRFIVIFCIHHMEDPEGWKKNIRLGLNKTG